MVFRSSKTAGQVIGPATMAMLLLFAALALAVLDAYVPWSALSTLAQAPPTGVPDSYTRIWDVQKAPDEHEYVRFATSTNGGGCALVHAAGCSHPDCVARRQRAVDVGAL